MAYTDTTKITTRLGADRVLRLFDRDGDGTADASVIAAAIVYAEAKIDAMLAASHGGVRFDSPGPVPDAIQVCATDLAIGWAGMAFPGAAAGEKSPYEAMHRAAIDLLSALARDREARLPASAGGAALPIRNAESYVDEGEDTALQWGAKTGF